MSVVYADCYSGSLLRTDLEELFLYLMNPVPPSSLHRLEHICVESNYYSILSYITILIADLLIRLFPFATPSSFFIPPSTSSSIDKPNPETEKLFFSSPHTVLNTPPISFSIDLLLPTKGAGWSTVVVISNSNSCTKFSNMEVLGAKKKKNKEIGIVENARRKQIAKEKTAKKGDTLFTTHNSFPFQFSVRLSCAFFSYIQYTWVDVVFSTVQGQHTSLHTRRYPMFERNEYREEGVSRNTMEGNKKKKMVQGDTDRMVFPHF